MNFETLRVDDGKLLFLDQTQLPEKCVELEQKTIEDVFHSIHQLKVRGAPAIGVAAAYGLLVGIDENGYANSESLLTDLEKRAVYLNSSRPTAVNLKWALDRMLNCAKSNRKLKLPELHRRLRDEATAIHKEDKALCLGIGQYGMPLIKEGCGVLTHCNAGALATTGIGTATAPMYLAHEKEISFKVYADETRPLLQGGRLTSWELHQSGLDVRVICDNMAASVMAEDRIDLIIVGTDRVAANGDIANKIGTLSLACLAKHFGIPFYIACPASTIDLSTPTGAEIPIETRDGEEVRHFGAKRTVLEEIEVYNPAFDVTPYQLITGIITEKGILTPPFEEKLGDLYGES